MVGITLRQELLNLVHYLNEQGILDFHFDNIRDFQNPELPRFVSKIISMYINDADFSMAAITGRLSDEVVNFDNLLTDHVLRLEARSGSIGGCRMAQVCYELHLACHERDKEKCVQTFARLKLEYQTLRDNLTHIRELENSILSYESRRHRRRR